MVSPALTLQALVCSSLSTACFFNFPVVITNPRKSTFIAVTCSAFRFVLSNTQREHPRTQNKQQKMYTNSHKRYNTQQSHTQTHTSQRQTNTHTHTHTQRERDNKERLANETMQSNKAEKMKHHTNQKLLNKKTTTYKNCTAPFRDTHSFLEIF